MPLREAAPVLWKGRRAFHLSNGIVEITVLLGGGHIADFRLCASPCNLLFESPWQTIEPYTFSPREHASEYGDGPVGKLLSGYTGHAVALGYFGMPTPEEAAAGLPLHGEAVAAEWTVVNSAADDRGAALKLEVSLPYYRLRFERSLRLASGASSVTIKEQLRNLSDHAQPFQWVEHAEFGEPLFTPGQSRLFLSATRGKTWPLGYEGRELLPSDTDFDWPRLNAGGREFDLSQPFLQDGTGFLAALLADSRRQIPFAVVRNSHLNLAVGYVFDTQRFPWITLWEENRAREYAPWNGITRARGVEFGNSPMPLGLQHAIKQRTLFGTPVYSTIAAGETIATNYHLFATRVSRDWSEIKDVEASADTLILRGDQGQSHTVRISDAIPSGAIPAFAKTPTLSCTHLPVAHR